MFKSLRPIWITEIGLNNGTVQAAEDFLKEVMPWLDAQPYVQRYAFFFDAPSAGSLPNLINANGTGLSAIGQFYNLGP